MHVKSAMYITLLLTVVLAPTVSAVCHSSLCHRITKVEKTDKIIRSNHQPILSMPTDPCHSVPWVSIQSPSPESHAQQEPMQSGHLRAPSTQWCWCPQPFPPSAISFSLHELIPTFWCLHLRPWVVERTPSPIKSFFGEEDEGVN